MLRVTGKGEPARGSSHEIAREFADPRLELVRLLHEAAQIEHALLLQYLYAAFSMRPAYREVAGVAPESGRTSVIGIAIEEMQHLREVNLILVELGASPSLTRQDFPYEPDIYPFPMRLERLTRASVAKYVYAEAPRGALEASAIADPDERRFAEAVIGLLPQRRVNHVGSLYGTVLGLLDELRTGELGGHVSAWAERIEQIKRNGEGDHYRFFRSLFLGELPGMSASCWDDEESEIYPSLPFARDPTALPPAASYPSGDPRALAEIGNHVYWAMLVLLDRGYRGDSKTAADLLRRARDIMSAVLLPLAELLAEQMYGLPFDPLAMGIAPGRRTADDMGFARAFLAQALSRLETLSGERRDRLAGARGTLERLHRDLDDLELGERQVVVAGSGPAGLAAALVLASRGVPVRVVEASTLVGGKASSQRTEDRSIEHGVHGWWPNYLNFDRVLELAGIDLQEALRPAETSALVDGEGRIHRVRFPFRLPSPFFVLEHAMRDRLVSFGEAFQLLPAFVHLLAFRHGEDYARYDSVSLEQLMRQLRVPESAGTLLFRPFALNFDYAPPERVSAASIMSALQFYLLHSKEAIVPRWSRGLPHDRIFGPLVKAIEDRGGRVDRSTRLESVDIDGGRVVGARVTESTAAGGGSSAVLEEFAAAEVPQNGFQPRAGGQAWAGRVRGRIVAFPNRCTHQGGTLVWKSDRFVCQTHFSEFGADGQVCLGPAIDALAPLEVREQNGRVQILGREGRRGIPCSDVIVATHVTAATRILSESRGVASELVDRMKRLHTTPVVVVRLWFEPQAEVPEELEAAFTPRAGFIDNFFHLNQFDRCYDAEGQVIEVHACRGKQDESEQDILNRIFKDLSTFCPDLDRGLLKKWVVQPHPDVFTLYAPGAMRDRPGNDAEVTGLHLAGDWTRSDRPVWMMERAVVSGLGAANRVLRSRGLEPEPIRELAPEALLLTAARWMARVVRRLFWSRDLPG